MTPSEIVQRIMSAHWDMVSCQCWVCVNGRRNGIRPVLEMLSHRDGNDKKYHVPYGWNYDGEKETD